jgi:hypothetical protein
VTLQAIRLFILGFAITMLVGLAVLERFVIPSHLFI